MIHRFLFLILCFTSFITQAQVSRDSVSTWALSVIQDSIAEHREVAREKLESALDDELVHKQNTLFLNEPMEGVSAVSSEDGRITIATFMVFEDFDQYQYFGYLVDHEQNKVIKLEDGSTNDWSEDIYFSTFSPEKWWGMIYYEIKQISTDTYLLFGYDTYSMYEQMKMIEVLDLSGGKIRFGKPVFGEEGDSFRMRKNRFFYRYSAMSSAVLRFDPEMDMIVMDHLTSIKNPYVSGRMMSVPDGTLSGYVLREGMCDYVDQVKEKYVPVDPNSGGGKTQSKVRYKGTREKGNGN